MNSNFKNEITIISHKDDVQTGLLRCTKGVWVRKYSKVWKEIKQNPSETFKKEN